MAAARRRLPPLPNTADLLRMYRIRAQRQLSQNFILSPTILDRFAKAWLPDGYSQIFRLYVFGPFGLLDYGSATLRCKI